MAVCGRSITPHAAISVSEPCILLLFSLILLCCRVVETSCVNLTRLSISWTPLRKWKKSIMFLTYIREVPGSNSRPGQPLSWLRCFVHFVPPNKCWDVILGPQIHSSTLFKSYYSLPTVHSTLYCSVFAQSKNCGVRGTDVANERLWNNIRF
jgi:hypothetical protein